MTVGFTGTSRGMTQRQRAAVRRLLLELHVTELHHGDCVGADAQVDADANRRGIAVYAHPPINAKLRAFCGSPTIVLPPKPYLKRNWSIVYDGEGLIAAPKDAVQPKSLRGQGTWTTIGYARKAGRRIYLVLPNGNVVNIPAGDAA